MSQTGRTEETATRLHSAAIHLLRHLRATDASLGVGPSQLSALSVIVFGEPMSLNHLAEAEQVKPPTMSRIIEALVRQGLAKRETNSADRRAVVVSATEKGKRVMYEGRRLRVKRFTELLEKLPQKDIASLREASEILTRILQG